MTDGPPDAAARKQAAREALYSERILAKSGDTVLLATLQGASPAAVWEHYPPGDVFDPDSGAQWYYHCHPPDPAVPEHGHFHCFMRPNGKDGPLHHLIAVGVDTTGRLVRLFTVNQWVVGDDWLDAAGTVALLPRFDIQLGRPSYLVNRWLTAIVRLYAGDIADLVCERDRVISEWRENGDVAARDDRRLEVTSQRTLDLAATAREMAVEG